MLWEFERLLDECDESGNLPQLLTMENVPASHNKKNIDNFNICILNFFYEPKSVMLIN